MSQILIDDSTLDCQYFHAGIYILNNKYQKKILVYFVYRIYGLIFILDLMVRLRIMLPIVTWLSILILW